MHLCAAAQRRTEKETEKGSKGKPSLGHDLLSLESAVSAHTLAVTVSRLSSPIPPQPWNWVLIFLHPRLEPHLGPTFLPGLGPLLATVPS